MTQITAIPLLSLLALTGGNLLTGEEAVKNTSLLENVWDANQWEPGSGRSFWHALPSGSTDLDTTASTPANRESPASPQGNPDGTDFSNRQSEK